MRYLGASLLGGTIGLFLAEHCQWDRFIQRRDGFTIEIETLKEV
jgi:hypothetical protein